MLTAVQIRNAIAGVLKANFPTYKVHYDNVEKATHDYFYVELAPRRTTVDREYYDRSTGIDIQLVLLPDKLNRIHRATLYDAIDTLDSAIRPVLQIGDRYITIRGNSSVIVDDILHYEFSLDFTDCLPSQESYELMQELYINGFKEEMEELENG